MKNENDYVPKKTHKKIKPNAICFSREREAPPALEAPRVRVEARDPVAALACLEHLDLLACLAALALLDPRGNRGREERG